MGLTPSPHRKISSRQLSVAAEATAAAQFALGGFDVLEQAGRAKFYDLGVATPDGMLKLSVYGSLNGFWNLADPFLNLKPRMTAKESDYHRAIDLWLADHNSRTCCLVQFQAAELNIMPRLYLASAREVAERLHESTEQLGDSVLYEEGWISDSAHASHAMGSLPAAWRFSPARVGELLLLRAPQRPSRSPFSSPSQPHPRAAEQPAAVVQYVPVMA